VKAFEELTHLGQVRRLRRLARVALRQYWQTVPQWAAYRQALLDGCVRVRPLPQAQLAHLGLLMAARHVSEILWAIDQAQHNAHFRQELDGWLEWAAAHVQLYLGDTENARILEF